MNINRNQNHTTMLNLVWALGVTALGVTTALDKGPVPGVATAIAGGVPIIIEARRYRHDKRLNDRVKKLENQSSENMVKRGEMGNK